MNRSNSQPSSSLFKLKTIFRSKINSLNPKPQHSFTLFFLDFLEDLHFSNSGPGSFEQLEQQCIAKWIKLDKFTANKYKYAALSQKADFDLQWAKQEEKYLQMVSFAEPRSFSGEGQLMFRPDAPAQLPPRPLLPSSTNQKQKQPTLQMDPQATQAEKTIRFGKMPNRLRAYLKFRDQVTNKNMSSEEALENLISSAWKTLKNSEKDEFLEINEPPEKALDSPDLDGSEAGWDQEEWRSQSDDKDISEEELFRNLGMPLSSEIVSHAENEEMQNELSFGFEHLVKEELDNGPSATSSPSRDSLDFKLQGLNDEEQANRVSSVLKDPPSENSFSPALSSPGKSQISFGQEQVDRSVSKPLPKFGTCVNASTQNGSCTPSFGALSLKLGRKRKRPEESSTMSEEESDHDENSYLKSKVQRTDNNSGN